MSKSANGSGPRPAQGLRGRIDAPAGTVPAAADFTIGGWVVHERFRVDRVLVTVDGEIAGHARVDVARPDVQARHPHVAGAEARGWSVTVPGVPGPTTSIRAYAHVETDDDGDTARLGPWLRFVDQTFEVSASGRAFGQLDDPGPVAPGAVLLTGQARAPGGLAAVELATDASAPVRARIHVGPRTAPTGPPPTHETAFARFAGYLRLDDATPATVRAVAVGLDGRRHELEPLKVEVGSPVATLTRERAATLRDRFDRRVAGLTPHDATPRVLVAAHSLDLGGAQLYLSLLLDRLRERGMDLVVASRSGGALQADLEAAGIPVLVYGHDPSDGEALEGQVLQVAELAREHGATACLANSLPSFPAVVAAQRLGLPTTWAVHESFDLDTFWHEAYGRTLPADVTGSAEAALAGADEVVFEAESTRRLYSGVVPAERASLVPYGVDTTAIDDFLATHTPGGVRADLGLADDALVLGCVGTVEPRKGQLALLHAFAGLPAHVRAGVQVVVVGMNDSAYSRAVRDFVQDAHLADSVHLTGTTGEIHPWYLACDVLVSASDIESVPRTMLEAMLCGRPVAATAAFGVGELVTDGETGFLCDPLDLGALRGMLERVIATERPRLRAMGEAARAHVARAHDPGGYVEHFHRRLASWVGGEAR